jgi:hypothetical protein
MTTGVGHSSGGPPPLVIAAASWPGRVLILATAALLFPPPHRFVLSALLLAFLVMPVRREVFLSLGSAAVLWRIAQDRAGSDATPMTMALIAATGLMIVWLAYQAARSFRRLPSFVQRHPQVTLHAFVIAAIAAAWAIPGLFAEGSRSAGWQVVRALRYLLPFLVWRCGYLLAAGQRGTIASTGFRDHAFWLLPIYGGSNTPFAKGRDYLQRYRAETPEAVAAAQLGGLKLLWLSVLWTYVLQLYLAAVNGIDTGVAARLLMGHSLGLPPLPVLLAETAGVSVLTLWSSLLLELIPATLGIAITGHAIVGTLRMFGFDAPPNTYRPLVAQRVLDFWNRYYFYFKELMFDFFFLPTYLSCFRTRPRLRIVTATMAAAFFGNFYYHCLRDQPSLGFEPPSRMLALMAPRGVYTLLLGVGIAVSMLRERGRRGREEAPVSATMARLRQVRRIAFVWLFYALIHLWVAGPWGISIGQRGAFFLALFGIRAV